MNVIEVVRKREIQEVLHFTTNFGLTGILASKAVKPRIALPQDKYLEHIYMQNCSDRSRDSEWHGYVNLSITKVNWHLFDISMYKWHCGIDGWWCILSFDPMILTHPGVYFATTNNIYTGVLRGPGAAALDRLFDDQIVRWDGKVVVRDSSTPRNQPTCEQAEVLYPGELSSGYLRKIYVKNGQEADKVESLVATLNGTSRLDCLVRTDLFEG